ncbi:MAG: DUF2911 domain-containing protein [Pedobacter sp.]|nr:MAG: DUF2911 domain-containing protein [Pedobacter sp.]
MKRLMLIGFFAILGFGVLAQDVKFPALDSSPADIAYFPSNVAKAKDNAVPFIKVVYSRPAKKGREIFGVLEQFGNVWRVGANESTEIRFYQPVLINNKKIKAGTYSLFAIPYKDHWTMIINKQTDKWGAFNYDQTKDILRTDVPVKTLPKPVEALSIVFTPKDNGAILIIAWDSTSVELPITIK